MELLKQRILQDGRCYPGGILKVDSFINHQMDPMLLYKVAEEFINRFKGEHINKIVTIEASGIAPAIMVGYILQLPVVFVKKKQPKTMENMLSTVVHSFTKDRDYTVCISNNFLTADDHILFIDDFRMEEKPCVSRVSMWKAWLLSTIWMIVRLLSARKKPTN